MTKSSFPHDRSYDYDADHVNGEIFDTNRPLPEIGSSVTMAPSAQHARAASALECGGSTPLSLSPTTTPKNKRKICQRHGLFAHECAHVHKQTLTPVPAVLNVPLVPHLF